MRTGDRGCYHGDPDRSDAAGILRQSRPRPRRQWRLCARDCRLRRSDQDPSRSEIPDQPRRRLSGAKGLRPRHRGLRRRVETRSEIPARLRTIAARPGSRRATVAARCRITPRRSVINPRQYRCRQLQEVAQEIERLGSLTYQKNLPSFNCATAKRQVEKAICADPGLAQLDRNINDVFLRVIASAEADSHRAALALTRQQRDFVDKRTPRSAAAAMTSARRWRTGWRSSTRSPGSRVYDRTANLFRLDLAQLPVTMPEIMLAQPSWPGSSRPSTSCFSEHGCPDKPGMTTMRRTTGETP